MGYRLQIETDECMSSGKCVADYPDAFAFDADELAVLTPDATGLADDAKLRVARNCPSRAIQLYDESGSRVAT